MNTFSSAAFFLVTVFCALFLACSSNVSPTETNVPIENNQTAPADKAQPAQTPAAVTTKNSPVSQTPPTHPGKIESAKVPDESQAMTENFNKLQIGMKYAEVARILGSAGALKGEFKTQNGLMKMYRWNSKNEEWNITARFDNDKLVDKVQSGLK